jgi:hypothetical protein
MTVRRTDGKLLSKGKGIVDSDGQYVTNSLEKGLVFFATCSPVSRSLWGMTTVAPCASYSIPCPQHHLRMVYMKS